MKFYSILILLILVVNQIFCLRSDDFCKKDARKIKICAAYNCGSKFCSFDKQTCDQFISWNILLNKWVKKPKLYKTFIHDIKNCKKNDYRNQWSHRFNFG